MGYAKEKSPFSYVDLLRDIIRQRSAERGVRVHDLKLQALRKRPTIKKGTWGTTETGRPMTRGDYEERLAEFQKGLPDLLFPPIETPFTLTDDTGVTASLADILREKRGPGWPFPPPYPPRLRPTTRPGPSSTRGGPIRPW